MKEHTDAKKKPEPDRKRWSRREAVAALGLTGAAVVAGALINTMGSEASVQQSVYGDDVQGLRDRVDALSRKLAHQWIDLEEDFPRLETESDDTGRLTRAVRYIEDNNLNNRKLYLSKSEYTVSSTIVIQKRGFRIIGVRYGRPSDPSGKTEGGTRIAYTGTGPCFQLGQSGGAAYNDAVQGFALEQITLAYAGTNTAPLNNPMSVSIGRGTYGIGTFAVKDYGNGGIQFRDVQIERFEYGFWGEYSDVNSFDTVNLFYNKVGMYIGVGSGQNTLRELYTIGNDTALWSEGAGGLRAQDCQFVKDGSAVEAPIMITKHGAPHDSAFFHRCWFEVGSSHRLEAFVKISCGPNAAPSRSIKFRDSYLAIGAKVNGEPLCSYFVMAGNASQIVIEEVTNFPQNLKKLVAFEGNFAKQSVLFQGCVDWDYGDGTLFDNLGTGEAKFSAQLITRDGIKFRESLTIEQPSHVRVYRGSSQSIAAATWTKVAFNTESRDNWGEFDTASGTFTAKAAGIYLVCAQVQWPQPAGANRTRLAIHLDGGAGAFSYLDDGVADGGRSYLSKGALPVQLNKNQTLDIRVWSEQAMSIQPGAAATTLSIVKIS
ncbi:hypothetical protein FE783_32330 [Paenibacillus mesophilus]|uniref:hypothetical protein n=1 Tax=Paenibacillus mesophilus TaxID=2582849 RepID=UPI00110EA5BF|nr:hypothetical protein [Paenibacillus mesophilus]TMV44479.1 hypothetical protein FE783_32330 [Paenibacillus mesophilus]